MRKSLQKRPTRKHFLLLEVLVCFTLLSMVLFPLLNMMSGIRKETRLRIDEIRFRARSAYEYAMLKTLVYQQGVPEKDERFIKHASHTKQSGEGCTFYKVKISENELSRSFPLIVKR